MTNVFVSSPESLVTTHNAYRAGFLEVALYKNKESVPYIEKARALYVRLKQETRTSADIVAAEDLREVLLEAAGFSAKTKRYLSDGDKVELLKKFVDDVLAETGDKYVDEIVYRYLMSLGEQLGGHMRNCIGSLARGKLVRQIVAQLQVAQIPFRFAMDRSPDWRDGAQDYEVGLAESVKAVSWTHNAHSRTFLNNVTVAGLSKNVDLVLLEHDFDKLTPSAIRETLADSKNIIMMGELKGGIDPAGADEHWKTARGALERIRRTYRRVDILFIGASIEKAMAKEIYSMYEMGDLGCVANLTNADQTSAACNWLIRL